jgi:hypothetical protein
MAKRAFKLTDEEAIVALPPSDLNLEIQRCLLGYETGGSSQGRKAFYDPLVWLEKIREVTHDIPAKRRRFGREWIDDSHLEVIVFKVGHRKEVYR